MMPQHHLPADIERTSMKIIAGELAQRGLDIPPENAAVVKRVIHTTADFDYAAESALFRPRGAAGHRRCGRAAIVTDTQMAMAGITKPILASLGGEVHCFMADADVAAEAKERGRDPRLRFHGAGGALEKPCIFAVGNAPTALLTLRR